MSANPKRIQLSRAKGWRKPEGAIVVARPSRWGNWFKVTTAADLYCGNPFRLTNAPMVVALDKRGFRTGPAYAGFADQAEAAAFAVELYRRSLEATYVDVDGPRTRRHYLADLAGHDLACWCPLDQPCHADVLLDLANREVPS